VTNERQLQKTHNSLYTNVGCAMKNERPTTNNYATCNTIVFNNTIRKLMTEAPKYDLDRFRVRQK